MTPRELMYQHPNKKVKFVTNSGVPDLIFHSSITYMYRIQIFVDKLQARDEANERQSYS